MARGRFLASLYDLFLSFKLVAINDKGAEAAGQGAEATYWSAILMMMLILGGAIVLGLGAAIYMVRDIRRGIGSILKPMGQLTDGELSVEDPHQGRGHRDRPDCQRAPDFQGGAGRQEGVR